MNINDTIFNDTLTYSPNCDNRDCLPYTLVLDKGLYKFELWGSKGHEVQNSGDPGRRSFISGNILITQSTKIWIYVGNSNGFNGGGAPGLGANAAGYGGGATDIRLSPSLDDRIIVAAAGGGGSSNYHSDANRYGGDGLRGGDGDCNGTGVYGRSGDFGKAGTILEPGKKGKKGITDGPILTESAEICYFSTAGGGGGGYFGGGGGGSGSISSKSYYFDGNDGSDGAKGMGGKGGDESHEPALCWFIYPSGSGGGGSSYASKNFTNVNHIKGDEEMNDPTGEPETGHNGNGYVVIRKLSLNYLTQKPPSFSRSKAYACSIILVAK